MSQKSKWVETSYLVGGEEIVLPLRCCVETRTNRIRTILQQYIVDRDVWEKVFQGPWVDSPNAHRVRGRQLDEAACVIADTIEDVVGEELLRSLDPGPRVNAGQQPATPRKLCTPLL